MKFLFAFVFFVIAVLLSLGNEEWQFAFIGVATIVGFLFGQVLGLSKQLKELRQALSDDWEMRNADQQSVAATDTLENEEIAQTQSFTDEPEKEIPQQNEGDYVDAVNQAAASVEVEQTAQTSAWNTTAETVAATNNKVDDTVVDSAPRGANIADKAIEAVKAYFTGGNIFVRIGIIILFFGVSFLLKYVSDRGFFPIEYRLIGVVVGAMCLLGLGWRLRHKNETYALLLQGAGIGILYLDIFAAFNMFKLIPATPAFVLLFIVSMFSAALAVLQNSRSLAVLGFSGGFLAPILASSGSNNHIGLFSYYAILNVAIVVIAWFKAWRELNLLGFAFTFIIGSVWGYLSYNSAKFSTTEPFLILFFVFYVLIAVLYALRQPPKLKGYVDGTLLFGVPLAASALQYNLVKDFEYGVSISSFVMGAFYMLLAWFIWRRKGEGLKLLAEAFLALGVIFASMAIPFALAPTQTAAAWALEGAGFIWLGSRQKRLSVRGFGVLLQIAAGAIFLWRFNYEPNAKAFLNGEFISSMMLAVAGIYSAWLLIKPYEGKHVWEKYLSPVLLIWGLTWLIGDFAVQLFNHYTDKIIPSALLGFTALLSVVLGFMAIRTKPVWKHSMVAAFTLFLLIIFVGAVQFVFGSIFNSNKYHPFMNYGWIAWPLVFISYYFLLRMAEKHQLFPRFQKFFHAVLILSLVFLATLEGTWWLNSQYDLQSSWLGIWYAVPATVAMWMIIKAKFWPFNPHQTAYRQFAGVVLAICLGLWSFIALTDQGTSDPLPWLPVLNPLDIMLGIVFITLYKWWQSVDGFGLIDNTESRFNLSQKLFNKRLWIMSFAGIGFLWLNFTLFRMAHHWFGVPWDDGAMFDSSLVQSSVSILWALTGVIATLYASRKDNRLLWIMGAVLLGLVVLKLFTIDLSALGSIGRVVSFLVVGALLISIGYFAPLPDKSDKSGKLVEQQDDDQTNSTQDVNNQELKGQTDA